ncbi:alpha/beta-hydrolase [Gloeophyllum trabeum ATCC 11539]|uniref:Carboxylic ester hydrolase n=1 Tax=Gloeophyllum trabeum (strain ATCC 11539 / FP-39264 / Madison 617) TaxID=670483 RepID=S7Q258_GLOTA|nr:alpha/beta-hydrolase [Gloeophyllum trabeum ATCC 11539]EPQ53622.1 alpha/beta-hydrolase [Gloeophyllum trabeum ATCC 11539]
MPIKVVHPVVHHKALKTAFTGVEHSASTPEAPVAQFRGIKYASIPARFRQSRLCTSYPTHVDATKYGPICPQVHVKGAEADMFGLTEDQVPQQNFKQHEFECLNLIITCPGDIDSSSRYPVMIWIHGGGNTGTGSSWVYDGGALVRKSILMGKPMVLVTFNYRLGILGFAAGSSLQEDNLEAGDEGVGNYGLRDQRRAMEWVHRYITEFGGDPSNVTLFGESTGAADILCHMLSAKNEVHPLFHRAIVQSAIVDHNVPDVHTAGWHLSRMMSALGVRSLEQLRAVDVEKLVVLGHHHHLRATDDGVFFRKGWKELLFPEHHHHHAESHAHVEKHAPKLPHSDSHHHVPGVHHHHHAPSLQPMIIGDIYSSSHLYSLPASLWTPDGVTRRIRAICQSLSKASALMRAYDIHAHTDPEDLPDKVLELITDARLAWPTECVANGVRRARGGRGVYRYVFDQEGPGRGPVDLAYVFDNVPMPAAMSSPDLYPSSFSDSDDEDEDVEMMSASASSGSGSYDDPDWGMSVVDEYSYARVRDAVQERWIAFAYGEAPWNEDNVFVFGPEGETGERSWCIFEGRRRRQTWREALEPLGMSLVQKVGLELSNGPPLGMKHPL